jgi:lipopolysaccharide/colanic/teichoic acid biosynthesis glycosyltransferase
MQLTHAMLLRAASAPLRHHARLYVLDRVLGAALFVVSLPITGLVALAVCVLSGRKPFIRHQRVGRNGERLDVIKIRTMWPDDATRDTLESKTQDDPRITSRFAKFCRRHSLDELPQLLQVTRGEMSLVGPRPLTRAELNAWYKDDEALVTCLKPGISGLWQVRGRNRLTYAQRRRLDCFLARNYGARLYFHILLATAGSVLSGRDAW